MFTTLSLRAGFKTIPGMKNFSDAQEKFRGFRADAQDKAAGAKLSQTQSRCGEPLRSDGRSASKKLSVGGYERRAGGGRSAPESRRGGGYGREEREECRPEGGRNDKIGNRGSLSSLIETRLPGGGAADPSRPSTDAGQPLRRMFASDYANGKSAPAGADRPGAREISNAVSASTGARENKAGASDLFWLWGQFLDHDIDLSPHGEGTMTIDIPIGDPVFDPSSAGGVSFEIGRSASTTNILGVEQQVNAITALIDASNVYGSSEAATDSLRSFEGGRLSVDAEGYMPKADSGYYVAGDVRANENIALTSMHTLFVREHNRLADEIGAGNPGWSDEQIFQAARSQVTAQIQAITVNEFLPILFGGDGIGDYNGPREVDAQIANSFSAAAYRFGHSMVSDTIERRNADGTLVGGDALPLSEAFFKPGVFEETGPDAILRGLAGNTAQAMDPEIVDSLRSFVLEGPDAVPFDLAALNITRGRDHGLPSLNDARRALGMKAIRSFDDPVFRDGVGARLAQVYDSPEDVDLWVGLLAEAPTDDGLVGPTQRAILMDQFVRLRDGDKNWYENIFTPQEIAALNDTSLADVIRRNTGVDDIQDNAMIAPSACA